MGLCAQTHRSDGWPVRYLILSNDIENFMKTDSQLQYDVAEALGWNAGFNIQHAHRRIQGEHRMTQEQYQWRWLDTRETVTQAELSHCCGMSEAEIDELVDYCALVPNPPVTEERTYSAQWVVPLRNASKMRLDFDLDIFTVAILLGNLNRIEVLERQVHSLQALLPTDAYSG